MKTLGPILGGLIVVALLVFAAMRSQRVLETGLPPRIEHATQALALVAAGPAGIAVLGTGSMAPYIPPAPAGRDPLATVVAYVTPQPAATFADVAPGALVIYRPAWAKGGNVMHQAALLTAAGWVMSGLHNERYEAFEPLTAERFVALVASAHVWP